MFSVLLAKAGCNCVCGTQAVSHDQRPIAAVCPYTQLQPDLILAVDETSQDLFLLLQRRILFVQAPNRQNIHRVAEDLLSEYLSVL
jgi:hypothetical protein